MRSKLAAGLEVRLALMLTRALRRAGAIFPMAQRSAIRPTTMQDARMSNIFTIPELDDLRMSEKARPLFEAVKRHIRDNVDPITEEFERLGEGRADRLSCLPAGAGGAVAAQSGLLPARQSGELAEAWPLPGGRRKPERRGVPGQSGPPGVPNPRARAACLAADLHRHGHIVRIRRLSSRVALVSRRSGR